MKIRVVDYGKTYGVVSTMETVPKVWEEYLAKYAGFLRRVEEGYYKVDEGEMKLEYMQPIAAVLNPVSRKQFLEDWASQIFPIHHVDELKMKDAALYFQLRNTQFMFAKKKGEEPRLLKRWISQWELMTEITMAFQTDGVFIEFPFELNEEDEKLVNDLIDKETDVKDYVERMKDSQSPFIDNMGK